MEIVTEENISKIFGLFRKKKNDSMKCKSIFLLSIIFYLKFFVMNAGHFDRKEGKRRIPYCNVTKYMLCYVSGIMVCMSVWV